jgi:putative ABC transport system substrate-binding protein
LARACVNCGAQLSATAKFCSECAHPAGPAAPPAPQRFGAPEAYTPRHLAERIINSKAALEGERKHGPADLEGAFAAMTKERAGAVIVLQDGLTIRYRAQIVGLAAQRRLPAMYESRDWTAAGGLMALGTNDADMYRRAATYVDKILKGARPGDLPVEQPTKFELLINLKTAKALGLTIPPSLLLRADQVIE